MDLDVGQVATACEHILTWPEAFQSVALSLIGAAAFIAFVRS